MAKKAKGFTIAVGRRPSGAQYWIVRGSVAGKQERKEFSVRDEALAYLEQRNSELFGVSAKQSPVLTRLTPEQVRNAEVVLGQLSSESPNMSLFDLLEFHRSMQGTFTLAEAQRLGPALQRLKEKFPDADLPSALDWFVANYRPPKTAITLEVALEHYLADVQRRRETRALSKPQFDRIGFAMAQLERTVGSSELLANLTTERLHEYLKETTRGKNGASFSNKTWNNRRGYLTAFLEFCRYEGWIETNPASAIRCYKKKDMPAKPPPHILTADGAADLMGYLETFQDGRLVPFYALCLFAGLRPDWDNGEISKLQPEFFKWDESMLKLPETVTKTKKPRDVQLQPNLIRWLRQYPIEKYPIICRNFEKLHVATRRKFALGHDVLRHTYCSMLVGKFRSVADTALQAGNSEEVMWSSYLNLVTESEARAFWEIVPRLALRNVTS